MVEHSRPAKSPHAAPEAPSGSPTYAQHLAAAEHLLQQEHAEQAAQVAAAAVQLAAGEPAAYILWARALAQEPATLAQAAQHYEQARALGSRDPALFAELASAYDVLHQYGKAADVYTDYLREHPDDAPMRDELGITLLLAGNMDEAVTQLARAHASAPGDPQIMQDLGYAYIRAQRYEAARDLLVRLARMPYSKQTAGAFEPTRLALRANYLARAYIGTGQYTAAEEVLTTLLTTNPGEASVRLLRARLYMMQGRRKLATDDYVAVLALQPYDFSALTGLCGAQIQLGRLRDAGRSLGRAKAVKAGHPLLLFRELQLKWRQGDKQAGEDMASLAEAQAADSPALSREIWQDLVWAAKRMHRPDWLERARRALTAAVPAPTPAKKSSFKLRPDGL